MTGRRVTMSLRVLAALAALVAGQGPARALDLPPGAVRSLERVEGPSAYAIATGAWRPEGLPVVHAEGMVRLEAWQVPGAASSLGLVQPLRAQLASEGFEILFECETEACGGFDFRYETELLPEPEMHVNLADFRFLAARRPSDGGRGPGEPEVEARAAATGPDRPAEAEYIALLASRSGDVGYLHIARITPMDAPPSSQEPASVEGAETAIATKSPLASAPAPLIEALTGEGRAVLDGVAFETGSARLAEGPFPALETLAEWLRETPEARVALVGHTDAQGTLPANIALSRARAEAVARYLVRTLGVRESQVEAEGVGYLMPLAPNTTEAGRTANRRVEVVLTSTR